MKKLTFAMIIAIGALAFGQVERSDVGDGTNGHPIVRGPGIVINGTLGSGGNWPMSTSTTQTGRLNRNLVVSACGALALFLIQLLGELPTSTPSPTPAVFPNVST